MNNISRHFRQDEYDSTVAKFLIELEGTPEAIRCFNLHKDSLTDYSYWFFLSTCWVKYSDWSDLELWKSLFNAKRPLRRECIMKPDELKQFKKLPYKFAAYRAHRENETDWISYTLSLSTAERFAKERSGEIKCYLLTRSDCISLFTRREESEIIMTKKERAKSCQP